MSSDTACPVIDLPLPPPPPPFSISQPLLISADHSFEYFVSTFLCTVVLHQVCGENTAD